MPDSDDPNRVTVHTVNGQELAVQHVVRHFERDWAYAARVTHSTTDEQPPNRLAIRNENVVAIDAPYIKRTDNPRVRIHHSGNGNEVDYEDALLVFETGPSE